MKVANNILLCLAGVLFSGFVLIIPDNTTTRRVQDEAWHMLISDYGLLEENTEVEVIRLVNADDLPVGRLSLSFNSTGKMPKGRMQFELLIDGNKTQAWGILYVSHYDWVMTATQTLSRDVAIKLADVSAVRMDITRERTAPLTESLFHQAVIEERIFLKRLVAEGQMLRVQDLRPALAADTGHTIRVDYQRNGMSVTLTCKARQSGIVGDKIRVYNPVSKTHYQVLLTSYGAGTWIKSY